MPAIHSLVKEHAKHPAVKAALAAVAVIGVGSIAYYVLATATPALATTTVSRGSLIEDISANGVVAPAENPTLAFATGGRVAFVRAAVGQKVSEGTVLASVDSGILAASLAAEEATLQKLQAGARDVDVAPKSDAVVSAEEALQNTYASLPAVLADARLKAESTVRTYADPYFADVNAPDYPKLPLNSGDRGAHDRAEQERGALRILFTDWDKDSGFDPAASDATLAAELDTTLARVKQVSAFMNDFAAAFSTVDPLPSASELETVASARDSASALVVSLTTTRQTLLSEEAALTSAKSTLALAEAPARVEDIAYQQARVASAEAQVRAAEIIAPFSGTVAAVDVKAGDVVSPNTVGVALLPEGAFQVEVYVSELEAASLTPGAGADITLDAYGKDRVFPATVSVVDRSPSAGGYKVTLVFADADPAIGNGMHANATIHAGSAENVLIVPRRAIIEDANTSYVLVKSPAGFVRTPVETGLASGESVEIRSGLSAGDRIAASAGNY